MNYKNFIQEFAVRIDKGLCEIGFKKLTDNSYLRVNKNHEINLIYIQQHSTKLSVSLNFGVHYDFLPVAGSNKLCDINSIELPDCEFKYRVTPAEKDADYWWSLNEPAINEIIKLTFERATEFFNKYDINNSISIITPTDVENGSPKLFHGITKVRTCLILASINEVQKNNQLAADFASLGIKIAGMAVGPKKILRQILKRVESS